jgi:hypothetical protein
VLLSRTIDIAISIDRVLERSILYITVECERPTQLYKEPELYEISQPLHLSADVVYHQSAETAISK